jgi:alkylation response protein AidB-like acyl-CoA dehydrogenase
VDFAFGEEQERLREAVRRFLEKRQPLAKTRESLESPEAFDRDVWQGGAALGWMSPLIPEAHGGGSITGQPLVDLAVVAEELGRVLYPGPFLGSSIVAFAVASGGTESQKHEILPRLARGETIATWCHTANGECDARGVEVFAARRAGALRLDGVARFVPDAHLADLLLVTAKSDGGVVQLLVPMPNEQVEVRVLRGLDLTRRLCEVRFDGAVVPSAALLESSLDDQLAVAVVLLSAETVGAIDRLFEMTVEYAKTRVQFGRRIGSFQAIQHKLANMLIWLEGSRAASHYAALAVDGRLADASEAVATAKSYVADAASALAGEALQAHGGIGFTWEHDLHLYLRRAKSNQVLYGDPTWHRERLCAMAIA